MRALVVLFMLVILAGCASTGQSGMVRLADARPYDEPRVSVLTLSQSEFRGVALFPQTFGRYSCRMPREGDVHYCALPADLVSPTLVCNYTRNAKWHLSRELPFPEAYICKRAGGNSLPKRAYRYTYEVSF